MIEKILNLPGLPDYSEYFTNLLSLAGVLLGLAFASFLYIMQDGFKSFQFSRSMFLEYYALFARNLLAVLSYLTLISIGVLYLKDYPKLLSLVVGQIR